MTKSPANDGSMHFSGRIGKRRLVEAVKSQTLISGSTELARAVIGFGILQRYKVHAVLMRQGEPENDILLIITGEVSVRVNGRPVAVRGAGTHVGEMALVDPLASRSATVVAAVPTVALRLPEHCFSRIATRHPDLW